jgi:mannose-1-phosphate guanylyltransferase
MRNDMRSTQTSVSGVSRALVVRGIDATATSRIGEVLVRTGVGTVIVCRSEDVITTVERAGSFDLIVVDGDGRGTAALDLIAYLRHRLPGTPVLFVSAADVALLAAEARERGATGCLVMPIEPIAAAAAIRAALDGRVSALRAADGRPLVQAGPVRASGGGEHVWGVVLAGGEGRRLRPLVRHVHGDLRPKQYARLVGTRSLLAQTLDRVERLVPSERTVVVSVRHHRRYLAEALPERAVTVLDQPRDRGTAAGIMLPVQWIARRDPGAVVAIFPSDHFIAHERRFMAHVADVVTFVDRHPARIVLVGAEATGPETEYGWIEPGEPLAWIGPTAVSSVARFVEKPSPAAARACLEAGALWNTFVVVARASALADVARQVLPAVHEELAAVVPVLGTDRGVAALRRAYAGLPAASFSTEVLERCAPVLAVSRLAGASWCDWGSPRRVIRTLRQTGQRPDWFDSFTARRLA